MGGGPSFTTGGSFASGGRFSTGGVSSSGGVTGTGGSFGFGGSGIMGNPEPFTPSALDPTTVPNEATNIALDAAHDNLQPNSEVASPLVRKWTAVFDGTAGYPLVANGRVYELSDGTQPSVSALRVDTGDVIWGPVIIGGGSFGLAYDGERLFSVDHNGNLSAFDASKGTPLWSTALTAQYDFQSPPVALDGKVYVNGLGSGGTTFAVDAATGNVLWQADTFDGSGGSVAVQGTRVFEAEACDQLSSFDAATGVRAWLHSGNCTGGGGATPSIYGNWIWEFDWASGNIIIDTGGHSHGSFNADVLPAFDQGAVIYQKGTTLTAVDITTSAQMWTFEPASPTELCAGPIVAGKNHRVFVATSASEVHELDAATGAPESSDTLSVDVADGCPGRLAVAEDRLFVPLGKQLFAY